MQQRSLADCSSERHHQSTFSVLPNFHERSINLPRELLDGEECLDLALFRWHDGFFPLSCTESRHVPQTERQRVTFSGQVAGSFKVRPIMFCDAGHKCRSVERRDFERDGMWSLQPKDFCVKSCCDMRWSCTFIALCHRCPASRPKILLSNRRNCGPSAGFPGLRMTAGAATKTTDRVWFADKVSSPIWHTFVCAQCAARHVSLKVGPRTTATLAEGEGVALICRVDSQITPPRDGFGEALGPVQAGRRSAQCARRSAVIPRVANCCSCCPQRVRIMFPSETFLGKQFKSCFFRAYSRLSRRWSRCRTCGR